MIKTVLLFSLSPLLLFCTDLDILFIGNSHTYFNDMPQMLDSLADAGGHDLYISTSVVGGSTLLFHYEYQPTLDSIAARDWDLVVLQEHSLLPVIEYWRDHAFFVYANHFEEIIDAQGAHTVLFMTHARGNAQGEYCIDGYCSPDFDDYFDMQEVMAQSYRTLAQDMDAILVPVGEVWAEALQDVPFLPLWHGDNSHASLEGGYLTACVFYQTLLGESPVGLAYHSSLTQQRAEMYQSYASDVVAIDEPIIRPGGHDIRSFPNPFNGNVQLQFQVISVQVATLQIFDHRGRIVYHSEPMTLQSGPQTLVWDGKGQAGVALSSGIYFVRLDGLPTLGRTKIILLK